jgi:hypothetical protein
MMSDCQLTKEKPQNTSLKGATLFAHGEGCIAPTAVYVSEKHGKTSAWNVILWFHGHHVKDIEKNAFGPDIQGGDNKLRESVDAAGQDVVLIVPFLGFKSGKVDRGYGLGNMTKGGIGVKEYLDQVLGLIGKSQGSDGVSSTDIDRLVLACHSGSDYLMRAATGQLGDDLKKSKLKQCWGFDCINSDGQKFGTWADGLPGVSFYFYVASGSIDYGHFPSHLIYAYGTPQKPRKPPMAKVFLAPGVNVPDLGFVPDDQVIETSDAIKQKQQAKQVLSAYEKMRFEVDPLLDAKKGEWASAVKKHNLKGHYELVQDLVKPRIERLFTGKP